MTNHEDPATVKGSLRLEAGIHPGERETLLTIGRHSMLGCANFVPIRWS